MNEPVIVDRWTLLPDHGGMCLYGRAYGHPRVPNGNRILSSLITEIRGHLVLTQSGTRYQLARPFGDTHLDVMQAPTRKAGQA